MPISTVMALTLRDAAAERIVPEKGVDEVKERDVGKEGKERTVLTTVVKNDLGLLEFGHGGCDGVVHVASDVVARKTGKP